MHAVLDQEDPVSPSPQDSTASSSACHTLDSGAVDNSLVVVGLIGNIQGVSSIKRVFEQLLGGIFKIGFSLGFSSNSGPIFANVDFGCFV